MAFGDSLRPTDGATVVLNVDTSQTQKLEQAEAQWRESVGTMSRESLKLDLAQDRLKKSLSAYGAESAQAKRATIALKDAEEQAARAADKQTRETQQLNRATRTASSGFASMRNRVVGLAAAYVGVYGLVGGIRSAIEAAKEEQNVLGQTKIAVQAAGLAWGQYEGQIQTVIRAQSQLGFDDEALMRTFQMFVRSTKDVNEAFRLNALAADVARGRYIDLEQAAQIVNKANLGMSGALRRIGLDVDKNAGRVKLLDTLTRNYGRSAEAAADDAVAASDRLSVEWENMLEIVGQGLLPAVTDLSDRLADYFGDAENQRQVQERVNAAIETGEDVVRGFAGAIKTAHEVLKPFVSAVGGAENAVKLLLLAFGVSKIAGAIAGIGRLLAAIRLIGPTSVASAATSVAAMNTIGTAATVNAGRVGALRASLATLPLGLAAAAVVGVVGSAGGGTQRGDRSAQYPRVYAAWNRAAAGNASPEELAVLQDELAGYSLANAPDAAMRRAEQRLAALRTAGGAPDTFDPRRPGTNARPAPRGGGGSGGGGGDGQSGPSLADLQLNVARAGASPGKADDVRALQSLRAYYARQIRVLEARKNLTAEQKEKLRALYGDIASTQSQLDAIEEAGEAKLAAQREEAERKRDAAREAAMERAMRRAQRRYDLLGDIPGTRAGMRRAALRHVNAVTRGLQGKKSPSEQMREEFRRMSFDFLTGLQGVTNQWGSNVTMGGDMAQVASHAGAQTMLLREQNRVLDRLTRSVQHPGAKYARVELAGLYGGVGGI